MDITSTAWLCAWITVLVPAKLRSTKYSFVDKCVPITQTAPTNHTVSAMCGVCRFGCHCTLYFSVRFWEQNQTNNDINGIDGNSMVLISAKLPSTYRYYWNSVFRFPSFTRKIVSNLVYLKYGFHQIRHIYIELIFYKSKIWRDIQCMNVDNFIVFDSVQITNPCPPILNITLLKITM